MTAPLLVSQRSAATLLGPDWTPRRFRRFVARHGLRVARDGHLSLVRVADVLAALGLADRPAAPDAANDWRAGVVASLTGGRR